MKKVDLQDKPAKKFSVWGYVKIAHVLGIFGWAIGMVIIDLIFTHSAILIEGKVTGIEYRFDEHEEWYLSQGNWYLKFEYEHQGQIFLKQSMLTIDPPLDNSNGIWEDGERVENYEIGEPVEVYIKANNPNEFLLSTFENRWYWPIFLGVFGIITAILYSGVLKKFL